MPTVDIRDFMTAALESTKPPYFSLSVHPGDADAGGILYHANYLSIADRACTEFLRSPVCDQERLAEHKLILVPQHTEIVFKKPAGPGDLLKVQSQFDASATSITLQQGIYRGDTLLADLTTKLACVTQEEFSLTGLPSHGLFLDPAKWTPSHSLPVRVYYGDTDASGCLYPPNCLRFAERERTEFLRSLGCDPRQLLFDPDNKRYFMITRIVRDYKAPPLFDDTLEVQSKIADLKITDHGTTSVTFKQFICRNNEPLVGLEIVLLGVNKLGRPKPLPEELCKALRAAYESTPKPS
jgi:acyl-CoA thioester hydrolase